MLNCPNCGAPLHGEVCEYCGTMLEIPVELMIGKEVEIRFKHEGRQYEFRTRIERFDLTDRGDTFSYYADASCYHTFHNPDYVMNLQGGLVGKEIEGRHVLFCIREVEE